MRMAARGAGSEAAAFAQRHRKMPALPVLREPDPAKCPASGRHDAAGLLSWSQQCRPSVQQAAWRDCHRSIKEFRTWTILAEGVSYSNGANAPHSDSLAMALVTEWSVRRSIVLSGLKLRTSSRLKRLPKKRPPKIPGAFSSPAIS